MVSRDHIFYSFDCGFGIVAFISFQCSECMGFFTVPFMSNSSWRFRASYKNKNKGSKYSCPLVVNLEGEEQDNLF